MVAMLQWRAAWRMGAGFIFASAVGGAVTALVVGAASLAAWIHALLRFSAMASAQPVLSSLAGLYLGVIGKPWSSAAGLVLLALWVLCAAGLVRRARRQKLTPSDDEWLRIIAVALLTWLLLTPYTHPTDLVLLAVGLPRVLGQRFDGMGSPVALLALILWLVVPEADLLLAHPSATIAYSVLVPAALLVALDPRRILGRLLR